MQVIENKNDTGVTVALDDKQFVNCNFKDCTLVDTGGDFGWMNTTFDNCKINLQGAAMRAAALMGTFGMKPIVSPTQTPPETPGGLVN